MSDLRQAAQRLAASGASYDHVYWDGNRQHDPELDARTLAVAWLAANDDEAVTEEWLRSIGWQDWTPRNDDDEDFDLFIRIEDEICWECRLAWVSNGLYVVRMAAPDVFYGLAESVELLGTRNTTKPVTRGQVRKICAALGIQLTEAA